MKKTISLMILLVLIFAFMGLSFAGEIGGSSEKSFVSTYLGKTSYGWVEKEVYGNRNSDETIVLIIGVHPLEHELHQAILSNVRKKSSSLSKKFVVYRVHVTKDKWDYDKGRMNGQLLAQKYVVPSVKHLKPSLVVDIHENRWKTSGYKYCRFLYPVSKTSQTYDYARKIIKYMPFLKVYTPPGGTSPKYVTIPIAKSGIPTLIYETYKYDAYSTKYAHAAKFIDALNK